MIKLIRKAVLASLGIFSFLTPAETFADTDLETPDFLAIPNQAPWRKSRLILDVNTGSKTISTADVMIPFLSSANGFAYINLMANYSTELNHANKHKSETNVGLGFRRVNNAKDAIYGVYAFYDSMKSATNNHFHQLTVGAEHLGLTWDFRANAYLPTGKTQFAERTPSKDSAYYDSNLLYFSGTEQIEKVEAGGDIEVGRTLFSTKLRAYLAAYSFGSDVTGPRARVQYQLNDTITFTASLQHDQARGTQYYFGTQITLGGVKTSTKNSIYNRLTDKVQRDVDIVTQTTEAPFTHTVDKNFYFVDQNTNVGTGTEDDPYSSVQKAVSEAPEDSVIFIKDGKTYADEDITLKKGQILWGASEDLYWNYKTSTIAFQDTPDTLRIHQKESDNAQPTITGTIHIDKNSDIYNLTINPSSNGGIVVDNAITTIQNVTVQGDADLTSNGITVTGEDAKVTLDQVHISNVDTAVLMNSGSLVIQETDQSAFINNVKTGINASCGGVSAACITVEGALEINGVTGNGIELHQAIFNTNDNVTINGINNTALASTMSAPKTTSTNEKSGGIYLDKATYNSTGGSTTINHTDNGIYANDGSTVNLDGDITINNSKADGIHLEGSASYNNAEHATTISHSGANGANIDGNDHTKFSTTALTISDSGETGFSQSAGELSIAGATSITNSGQDGLALDGVTKTKLEALGVENSNRYGISLNDSNLTVTGSTDISNSKDTSVYVQNSAGDFTTHFNSLTIHEAQGYGVYQVAGKIIIDNDTLINSAITEPAVNDIDAFYTMGADVKLNDLTINLKKDGSSFSSGVSIHNGSLISLGDVSIHNTSGTALELSDITMNPGDKIASVTISGENQRGIQLINSDFTVAVAGDTNISDSTVSSFSATGMANHNSSFGSLTIAQATGATGDAFAQEGGSVNINGVTSISGTNTIGMNLTGGTNLTATGDVSISDSTVSSFSATNMAAHTTTFAGNLMINQAGGDNVAAAFSQDGGMVNINDATNISGPNTIGMNLTGGTNLTATGDVKISGSTNSGFNGTGTTDFKEALSITMAENAIGDAFIQTGGSLTINRKIDISIVGNSVSNNGALTVTNASTVSLGDINIGVGAQAGIFANGINLSNGNLTHAGSVTINNTSQQALTFSGVAMQNSNTITKLSIDGSQKNGVTLTNSALRVNGVVSILGSTVSSFSATGISANSTSSFGSLTIAQAAGATGDAFVQDGGSVNIQDKIDISGSNAIGINLTGGTNLSATGAVNIEGSVVSSFSATGMKADNETTFGSLTIVQAAGATGDAFTQDGGSLSINGETNLSVADGGTANTAFNVTDASSITLGNVNIAVGVNGGEFLKGINLAGAAGEQTILSAGDITIDNIAANGTALSITNTNLEDGGTSIESITIEHLNKSSVGLNLQNTNLDIQNNLSIDGLGTALLKEGYTGLKLGDNVTLNVFGDVLTTGNDNDNSFCDFSATNPERCTGIYVGTLDSPVSKTSLYIAGSFTNDGGDNGITVNGGTVTIGKDVNISNTSFMAINLSSSDSSKTTFDVMGKTTFTTLDHPGNIGVSVNGVNITARFHDQIIFPEDTSNMVLGIIFGGSIDNSKLLTQNGKESITWPSNSKVELTNNIHLIGTILP